MNTRIFLPLVFTAALFAGCTKEITIDLPEVQSKIVVDGGIFTGEFAQVTLTNSAGYFDPVDSASLAGYLISNATVTLTDGTQTDTLRPTIDFTMPIPFVYRGSVIQGQVGRTYTLTVVANGQTVTAVTTIPQPVALDSLWFELDGGSDSLGFVWANLNEPAGLGNGYRWFAKRVGRDDRFLPPFGSAFFDKFIDGQDFDFGYTRGMEPGSTAPDDDGPERGRFRLGDTVVVRFCSIGPAEVEFFRSYESIVSNQGNPFAAPGVVETNVQGGLGIFCGYSPTLDTLVLRP
ncbi:MAG: DUF4249 domain-containing protein [Bacteroidetes bacterium]|nr:DUF4249 domain-containing protein [Bacteroidota bacterium]